MKPSARAWCQRVALFALIGAVVISTRATAPTSAQSSGPEVALAFSEGSGTTTADASGNGNAATFYGETWTTGKYGGGMHADGTSHTVQIPSSASLSLTNGFTIETWIKPTAGSSGTIVSQFTPAGYETVWVNLQTNGSISFTTWTTTNYYPLQSTPTIAPGVWTHVAITSDGAMLRIYMNGVSVAQRPISGTIPTSSLPFKIGDSLNADLDEFRIYGRALSAAELAFDRGTPVDAATPFQVTLATPAGSALGVVSTPVTAMFGHDVDASTVTTSTFGLRDSSSAVVPSSVSYNASTRTATLTPTSALSPLSDYTAHVVSGASGVKDSGGNALGSDTSWTFRTAAAATVPSVAYAFSEGTGTTTADWSGNGNTALFKSGPTWTTGKYGNGVHFAGGSDTVLIPASESLAFSNAFTFEAWVYPSAAVRDTLWTQYTVDGIQIASVDVMNDQRVYFVVHTGTTDYPLFSTSAVALNTWTHVAATYDGSSSHIYLNGVEVGTRSFGGTMPPMSSLPMYLGQFTQMALDEVRIYRSARSAAQIASDASTPVDTTPPLQVTTTTPADGRLGVLTTPITVTFNRAVDASTVNTSTIVLRDGGTNVVAATVSYNASTRTATVTPTSALASLAPYSARVVSGSSGVHDATGGTMAADATWTFTTAAPDTVPSLAYAFSEGAGVTTSDVSGNGNTGTLLHSPTWTAGRFGGGLHFAGGYDEVQAPATETLQLTNTFTFEAWLNPSARAWGDVFASYAVGGGELLHFSTTSSGTIYFAPVFAGTYYPVFTKQTIPLNAWTHVAVTYDGSKIHVFLNGVESAWRNASGSFAGTLQPLEIGEWYQGALDDIRVYRRALSASEIALDYTTPTNANASFAVTVVTPSGNSRGVLITPITAAFSHAADASTVTTGTVELRDASNVVVPATVSYDAATRTATLTPTAALAPVADYTARVIGGSSGVKDGGSQAMAADTTWTFRTAAPSTVPSLAFAFAEGSGTTTADASGNGNAATLVSGPTWANGKFDQALQFAAGYDRIELPPSDTLTFSSGFTFEAWVNPTAAVRGTLWTHNRLDGYQVMDVEVMNDGHVFVVPHIGALDYPLFSTATVPLNVWTHVAATYDGANLRIYINGSDAGSRPVTGSLSAGVLPIELGESFEGRIDEVRVYRRALSAAEISADMAAPIAGPMVTSITPPSGLPGQSITIYGAGFGTTQGASTVTVNGVAAAVTSWSATAIVITVPLGDVTGAVVVTVNGQSSAVGISTQFVRTCTAFLSPSSLNASGVGKTGYLAITNTGSGCAPWTPTSDAAWLTFGTPNFDPWDTFIQRVVADEPIGYWGFHETVGATTAYDYTGHDLTAVLVGGAAVNTLGFVDLNGVSGKVIVHSLSVGSASNTWSIVRSLPS